MHLSRESRATLVAAVILAGIPVLSVAAPATADPFKEGICTILGTADDDVLTGTDGDDVNCGLGGDDKLAGQGGDDVLRGGGGVDIVRGGPGNDRVAGGRGSDRCSARVTTSSAVTRETTRSSAVPAGTCSAATAVRTSWTAPATRPGLWTSCVATGADTAAADPGDIVKSNCETIAQNDPPTDITLVPSTIPENEPIGTDIGRPGRGRSRRG